MSVSPITCHILDTTLGRPASGVHCELTHITTSQSTPVATALTDTDGRIKNWKLIDPSNKTTNWITEELRPGIYKVRFNTSEYFVANKRETFFPFVDIVFEIAGKPDNHYHIPLLLSNYGYSTYRGS